MNLIKSQQTSTTKLLLVIWLLSIKLKLKYKISTFSLLEQPVNQLNISRTIEPSSKRINSIFTISYNKPAISSGDITNRSFTIGKQQNNLKEFFSKIKTVNKRI